MPVVPMEIDNYRSDTISHTTASPPSSPGGHLSLSRAAATSSALPLVAVSSSSTGATTSTGACSNGNTQSLAGSPDSLRQVGRSMAFLSLG
eukprot:670186-Amphidinium_carterae.1